MAAKKTATAKKTTTKRSTSARPVKSSTVKVASKKVVAKATTKPVAKKTVSKVTANKTVKAAPVVSTPNLTKKMAAISPKKLLAPVLVLIALGAAWLLKDQVIVATVNGQPITRIQLISKLEQQGGSQILESIITQSLVEQALKKAAVTVSEDEVDAQMKEIEDSIAAQGQNLDDLLAMQNLTREDVAKDIRLNLQVEKLLADKIAVTDEEVQAYFDSNKELLGEDADFEMMKEQIRAQVEQEKQAEAQQDWLDEIRNEAKIQYFRFKPLQTL